ncbi:tRNA-dihydrouridine synthase [Gynuella sunshinyii]
MRIILAPMEGLMDYYLRTVIKHFGGCDLIISEFVRVVDALLPESVFLKTVPELTTTSSLPASPPVRVQLLGSDPNALADNALRALSLGSSGIDLNFGCPSKTVNNHNGGAVLLKEPEKIYRIINTVKTALPQGICLSAKMRLGYDDTSQAIENALAMEAGGAEEITVHARTKVEGYQPPAHWDWIARINEATQVNIIANGDIFSVSDYDECIQISGCQDIMIGRGLVYQPDLAMLIKDRSKPHLEWQQLANQIHTFFSSMQGNVPDRYICGRLKQWLKFLATRHEQANKLFETLRPVNDVSQVRKILQENLVN